METIQRRSDQQMVADVIVAMSTRQFSGLPLIIRPELFNHRHDPDPRLPARGWHRTRRAAWESQD